MLAKILDQLRPRGVKLIAVSKTKPADMIMELYNQGQRAFGENRVQEITTKHELLPDDIEWHFIGHLQTNKVKYLAPFVNYIHAVDSQKLLNEINKQAAKNNRVIKVLLQFHIAEEESKFGFNEEEAQEMLSSINLDDYQNVQVSGVMGMATFTDDKLQVSREFKHLKEIFDMLKSKVFQGDKQFTEISMGMSGDYQIAIEEGSTMVRIGTLLFGKRG